MQIKLLTKQNKRPEKVKNRLGAEKIKPEQQDKKDTIYRVKE